MTESRLLHELEQQKIKKLRQQSQHLYHRVWQHYMGNNCLATLTIDTGIVCGYE